VQRAASIVLSAFAMVACGGAGCGGRAALPQPPPSSSPRFESERARAIQRALVELGPRPLGSDALDRARRFADALQAATPQSPNEMRIVLLAPLATGADDEEIEAASAAAAVAAEAARALAAGGTPVALALEDDLAPPFQTQAQLAAAQLAISIPRGCGVPERRDLLSHRVLREHFFAISRGADGAPAFAQANAGQRALLAAGALRVVALDAPPREERCDAAALGPPLVAFVRDAARLLERHGMNSGQIATSHDRPEAPRAPQRSSP
jgi:hypothetical protein